jgi:hypothetical protein
VRVNERQKAVQGNSEWTPEGNKQCKVSKKKSFEKERMKRSSGRCAPGEEGWRSWSDQKRLAELQAAGSLQGAMQVSNASSALMAVKHEPRIFVQGRGILSRIICARRAFAFPALELHGTTPVGVAMRSRPPLAMRSDPLNR